MSRPNGYSFSAVQAESSAEPTAPGSASRGRFARPGRGGADRGRSARSRRTERDEAVADVAVARPEGVQLRARRNPRLLALGILLACLGGLGAALLWQQTAHSRTVVVMARHVEMGHTVSASDITTSTIGSAPGIAIVPGSEIAGMVGKVALTDLASGALVAPGQIGDLVLPTSDAEVGLKLDRGRAPGAGLVRGTRVQLVPVSGSPSDAVPAGQPVEAIVATQPQANDTGESVVLDVDVAPSDAARVAQLAARQQLAVVLEAQK